ncbi:MAG: YdcF family protein, partial [Verrucomicrobiota bacterium]|nr:YdcF family protein [Verrucomicrobiota bacterium]
MPNYGYHLARARGRLRRRAYLAALPLLVRREIAPPAPLDLAVVSYSNEQDLPEQVASIRSFLKNAGHPRSFTIVSDGSHSARSLDLLRAIDPVVAISQAAAWLPPNAPRALHEYLRDHPTGKQLAIIMSLPVHGPTLYLDSDVRFFAGARDLPHLLVANNDAPASYLADCQLSADDRLFRAPS